jgi:hypothetical protein
VSSCVHVGRGRACTQACSPTTLTHVCTPDPRSEHRRPATLPLLSLLAGARRLDPPSLYPLTCLFFPPLLWASHPAQPTGWSFVDDAGGGGGGGAAPSPGLGGGGAAGGQAWRQGAGSPGEAFPTTVGVTLRRWQVGGGGGSVCGPEPRGTDHAERVSPTLRP